MKLYYSPTSPYARKVRMVVIEKGLQNLVEFTACNPFEPPAELLAANPLGRVPTLILSNGEAFYDSTVITRYLDALTNQPQLIPATGIPRWEALRWEALADGVIDASYAIAMENRRKPELQSAPHKDAALAEICRALSHAEQTCHSLGKKISLAHIAFAAALGYLDLRVTDLDWRRDYPQLARFLETFDDRESFTATDPLQ